MRRLALLLAITAIGCGDDAAAPDAGPAPADADIDAPPAACGIEQPGSRCADARTLERCDGEAIETVDCGAQGRFCGPDPAGDAAQPGAACIATGDPCGWIDYYGACADAVLVYCLNGVLEVADCGANWSICAYTTPDIGYNCTTECAEMSPPVTAEGDCDGGGILHCVFEDGAYHVRTDPCPAGTVCEIFPDTGWPACMPDPPCSGVGPQGRCTGDTLTTCTAGVPQSTNCAGLGEVCAYGGDAVGYTCAPPGDAGAFQVSGTISYEDRPPSPSGLGARVPAPVRGAAVAVVADDDGSVLAFGVTSDDGSYMLRYDASAGEQVHVLVATTSSVSVRPVRVLRPDGLVHGAASPSFAAAATTTRDLLVTDESGLAPAFNVFDMLVLGLDATVARMDVGVPQQAWAQWTRGAADGTYYLDWVNGMFLLGEAADDDGYDDAVIIHELGHHIEDAYGRSDSPGGAHGGEPTDPRLAWSEGFATYFSSVVRDSSLYMDSNAAGGWYVDLESMVTTANPGGAMTQDVSEDMVGELLWDIGDAPAGDDDARATAEAHTDVLRVQTDYLRGMVTTPRGVSGIDLVDFLDGWFQLMGLSTCAGVESIVASRLFPYDFSGPAGACP